MHKDSGYISVRALYYFKYDGISYSKAKEITYHILPTLCPHRLTNCERTGSEQHTNFKLTYFP